MSTHRAPGKRFGIQLLTPTLVVLMLLGAGLAMSLGHCLGMCGPLVGGLAGAQRAAGMGLGGVAVSHLVYHSGRIGCYALIGLVFAGMMLTGSRL